MTTKRKSPAFSFYPDSWFGGTMLLEPEQRAAYIDLLSAEWLNGPLSKTQAHVVCRGVSAQVVDYVLDAKFELVNGLYQNNRLEQERGKQQAKRESGSKGGSKRQANFKRTSSEPASKHSSENLHSDSDSVSDSVLDSDSVSDSKNSHTHTPRARKKFDTAEFEPEFSRWCAFRLAVDGRDLPEPQVETLLMDLGRRGVEKAKRDIDFSIAKGAKSILDSDNDFQQRSRSSPSQRNNRSMSTAELLALRTKK